MTVRRPKALPSTIGILLGIMGLFCLLGWRSSHAATTQLPPGEVCFQDANGPVSNGSLNMFYPGTTTPKLNWTNVNQTVQNTQPIQLDANGCAIIYGVGTYRQMLYSGPVVGGVTTGNLIFDLPTTDTSAFNSIFWAGTASGTANAISIVDAGFANQAGSNIQFLAIAENTGATTIAISGGTSIPIEKDTNAGPVPLTGGEIGPNNAPSLLYDSTNAIFHLINPAPAATSQFPVGGEVSCPGFAAPTNFLFEYGQAVSRTTYSTLLSQLTSVQTGTLTNGLNTVSALTDTSQLAVGDAVEGAGVPGGTTVASIVDGTDITMSANATASGSASLRFFAYGNGDGSTTFNLPDRRGYALYGRDNMGGTAASNLTSTYTTNTPDALGTLMIPFSGSTGGAKLTSTTQFPAYTPTGTIGSITPAGTISGISLSNGAITGTWNISNSGTITGATTAIEVNTPSAIGVNITGVSASLASNVTVSSQGSFAGTPVTPTFTGSSVGSSSPFPAVTPGRTTNFCIRAQ